MGLARDGIEAGSAERGELVEAMAESCLARGYQETSVEHLLAATGLARADFEAHFRSREECALAAVDLILAEGIAAVSAAYLADAPERESALQALRKLLVLFADGPALANLAFTASRQAMPAAALQRYEAGFAVLTAMLDRLRADSVNGDRIPATAARAAIGAGEALVRRELAAGRADQLPRLLPDIVYSATVPFLGREEALRLAARAAAV